MMPTDQFNLNSNLINYLNDTNIYNFSEVQLKVIPLINKNKNVMVEAPTGSGKTLSFLLPILNSFNDNEPVGLKTIIFVPTRELGTQITILLRNIRDYNKNFTYLNAVGGKDIKRDLEIFKKEPNIIVATPSRLLKLFELNPININSLKYVVIDEIDMISSFGFLEDILTFKKNQIKKDNKVWLFFSATFSLSLQNFVKNKLQISQIENIRILNNDDEKIHINLIKSNTMDKREILLRLLNMSSFNPYFCLIFAKSSNEVSLIYKFLREHEIGDLYFFNDQLNSKEKNKVMKLVHQEKIIFLVTTDLVARGLDFPGVTHIINYNYPSDLSFYKHRIGRTNRMNNVTGTIYDIYNEENDGSKLKLIQEKNKNLIFTILKVI